MPSLEEKNRSMVSCHHIFQIPMHSVYCFYSSIESSPKSSDGVSDDKGPKIPSELRVNPLSGWNLNMSARAIASA
uniref:Pco138567b n=1 Tax=Arundo donax TaxID=35708 RepID=A0A0A9FCN8_ARUDO